MTQVFISYSRKDLAFVERLAKDLQAAGLEVWYDLSGLDGGTRWGREIQSAIKQSQIFVVVLSPNSIDSEWVEKEFMYANSLKRKIIPLLYQPCETPMWFINLHFIDVQGENYDSHFWVILKAMGVNPGDLKKEFKPAAEVPSIQTIPESQIQSAPPVVSEGSKAVQPKRRIKISPVWIIGLVGLAAVTAFAVWGMPALSARLAPTPTATATATATTTQIPTSTTTPTLTLLPSLTLTPRPTTDPNTGTVHSSVWWNSKPFAGVLVTMCSDWLYTCKGIKFSGVSDAGGNIIIKGITPGEYQVITKYPGQIDETRLNGTAGWPVYVKVLTGEIVNVDPIQVCKMDLFIYSPAISNGTSVTFSWRSYPGAAEYLLQLDGNNGRVWWSTGSTSSFKILQSGNYQLIISVGNPCVRGIVNFTVP